MSDDADVLRVASELRDALKNGEVLAVAFVTVHGDGGLLVRWGAAASLGDHAGSILRGAVAYLGARMDAKALE
jgi:hypothetical protein